MSENVTQSQVDLANQLNDSLRESQTAIQAINSDLSSQAELLTTISESFLNLSYIVDDINIGLVNTQGILNRISEIDLSNLATGLGQNANNSLNTQNVNVERFNELFMTLMSNMSSQLSSYNTQQQTASSAIQSAAASESSGAEDLIEALDLENSRVRSLNVALRERSEANEALNDSLEGLSAASFAKNAVLGSLKAIITAGPRVISNMIGIATQVGMALLTLPMTITREMAAVGNKLREDLVEGLGQSVEDMKEKFNLGSYIGKSLMSASSAASASLKQFQDPTDSLVKKFGYGIEGVKKYFTRLGDTFESLGNYSEVYANTFSKNEKRYLQFLDVQDALGFSSEDLKYFAMDAYNNVELLEDRMSRMASTIKNTADAYNVDMKQLSKNTMTLRKDIILFGHISDENLTDVALNMTKMKVKIEDAAAVFNKFSTFEDAAKSSAILSQTFGMNINAMDLIRAERPDEIFQMFSDAMELTGRSFSDLSRHEKAIMAQQTGMSAESLNAIMNYKAMGLTFEEARQKMEQDKPEKRQLAALKELKGAIKEINKILTFKSPFEALTKGFMERLVLADDAKSVLTSLSGGYESLYQYALKIKPGTINKLVQPISYIITIMKDIFESDGFKNSVINILEGMGDLLTTAFNYNISDIAALNPEKLLEAYDTNNDAGQRGVTDAIVELHAIALRNKETPSSDDTIIFKQIDELRQNFNDESAKSLIKQIIKSYKLTPEEIQKALPKDLENKSSGSNNATAAFNRAAKNNAGNLSTYLDLTQTVTGSVFRATFAGITALLESGTEQLNKVGKIGNDKPWYENLLGISPEDFQEMNERLRVALEGLFKPSESGGDGLFSSFFGFFKDQFIQIASEAMSILGTIFGLALNAVLGRESKIDPKNKMQTQAYAASRGINEENALEVLKQKSQGTSLEDASNEQFNTINTTLEILGRKINSVTDSLISQINKLRGANPNADYTQIDTSLEDVVRSQLEFFNTFESSASSGDYNNIENAYNEFLEYSQELSSSIKNFEPQQPASVQDFMAGFENALPPKSMFKLYDSEGREIDTNSKEASLNSGGVVADLMKKTKDISLDAEDIGNSAQQIYLSNTFKPMDQKNKLKQKLSELNGKIKEVIGSQGGAEDSTTVTPVLDKDAIIEIGKVLANNNFVKMLSDPRYTQGGYLIAARSLESPTLNTGELNVAPNYLYDVD